MKTILLAAALLVTTAATARGATVYTPALSHTAGGYASCLVVNVSSKARTVTLEIRTATGSFVYNSGERTVEPGHMESLSTFAFGSTAARYCAVTVAGGKNTIRVTYESRNNGETQAAVVGY